DLPPIRYSYFNPDSRRYEVASTNATKVHVGAGTLASADTGRSETLLSLRTRYRGAPSVPLHEHPLFWAFLALAPVPAITFGARDRRRRSAPRTPDRIAHLTRLAKQTDARDACDIRRAFAGALSERLKLESETFTRPGALARSLRRRGVSTEVAQK